MRRTRAAVRRAHPQAPALLSTPAIRAVARGVARGLSPSIHVRSAPVARCSDTRRDLGLIAAPCGLLLAGAAIGLPLTLDPAPAWERLLGVCGALGLGVAGLLGLRRLADGWVVPALLAAASASLLGSFWIVAGVGADSFRGPVGALLQRLFQPLFGRVAFADPIAIANTRFIFGYNGVSDLCLVALWTSGAALWTRPGLMARL